MLSPGPLSGGWTDSLDPQLRRLRSSEHDVNLERRPPPPPKDQAVTGAR